MAPRIETQTLQALVLHLTVLEGGTLSGGVAELAHAAFYAVLTAVDPPLAARLHDAQERAAFTLSPLHGLAGTVSPGQTGRLRVTLLDETVFAAFAHHLLAGVQPTLRLGRVVCLLSEVLGAPGSDPWAGYTMLETLAAPAQPRSRWTLEFASPTAIR